MPNFDGTGPFGYGRGQGYGRGGCGAGHYTRWFHKMTKEEEVDFVCQRIDVLEKELTTAKERLSTLKGQ